MKTCNECGRQFNGAGSDKLRCGECLRGEVELLRNRLRSANERAEKAQAELMLALKKVLTEMNAFNSQLKAKGFREGESVTKARELAEAAIRKAEGCEE